MRASYETKKYKQGFSRVVGCDEVGRGCLAGPVVAAAVVLDLQTMHRQRAEFDGIKDSKLLSAPQREIMDVFIKNHAAGWGIGMVDANIIDTINIHNASLLAMRLAVENMLARVSSETAGELAELQSETADAMLTANVRLRECGECEKYFIFVDGKFTIPEFDMKQEAVVDGDNKILSIAAASIVAKVYRDRLMEDLHSQYPAYGFRRHKGYATLHHRTAIAQFGITPHHRTSFCKNLSSSQL